LDNLGLGSLPKQQIFGSVADSRSPRSPELVCPPGNRELKLKKLVGENSGGAEFRG